MVGMCCAGFAVALPAPWQLLHVPGTTPVWSKFAAGDQALVRWQVSHDAVVWIWLAGLLVLRPLLWQLWQEPGATPAC